MSDVLISSQEVFEYASSFKSMNQQVQGVFEDIGSKMRYIESIWSSPASTRLMEMFQSLQPVFQTYTQALDQYALFLEQTAQSYQENEQVLMQGIGS